jgi:hypothetical protein
MTRRARMLLLILCLPALAAWNAGCSMAPAAIAANGTHTPAPPTLTPTVAPPSPTATLTATPQPTATNTASPTATVTATATATATATPVPAARRLTQGGCCFGPFWLDGQIVFIDKPSPKATAGFYAVSPQGGEPKLIEARLGNFILGGRYFSYQDEQGNQIIERRSDGQRLNLPTPAGLEDASGLSLSPDATQVVWRISDSEGPFDQRQTQLWLAAAGSKDARKIITLYGGGLSAWLPDGRWLLSGRRAVEEAERALFVYDLASGQSTELFRALSFRNLLLSPDGAWIAFTVTLDPKPERDGLWLVRTDGKEQRKLDFFGAYAWRDAGFLYYIPYQPAANSHEIWAYHVASGRSVRVTDAALTPFKVAQGDLAFAPDGRSVAFVSASDLNLWLIPLPAEIALP